MGVRKIIVGVHGIGDQVRNETIRAIVRQFCKYYRIPGAVPLGRYHTAPLPGAEKRLPGVFVPETPPDPPFPEKLAFGEVYWADIPRRIDRRGYTLEEETSWANSIVERLDVRYGPKSPWPAPAAPTGGKGLAGRIFNPPLSATDFVAIKAVLSEMIESLKVMESLTFLAGKAGLFTFDLKKLLDDFIGDVQIVTEFEPYRDRILERFADVMRGIHQQHPRAEIHIIAHSEGTVVAFLGLLKALGSLSDRQDWEWLQQVRGFMTIGSPIDKHIILWPRLWEEMARNGLRSLPEGSIRWRNYYDLGDPVGYDLDTARCWLESNEVSGFQFIKKGGICHDFGFSRYPLPGKAHVDYWDDEEVFGHFINQVVDGGPDVRLTGNRPRSFDPPKSKKWSYAISTFVSYLLVLTLIIAAVYLLDKALLDCLNAVEKSPAAPQQLPPKSAMDIIGEVAGLALLLSGLTAASRIPRLVRRWHFRALALAIFSFCALLGRWMAGETFESLGALICNAINCRLPAHASLLTPSSALLATATAVLILTWLVKPSRGKWTLLISGGAVALLLVLALILGCDGHGPLWPVVLAGGMFFYLWWLAILLFDLVFTWHYYIRNSNALKKMNALYRERSPT